MNSVMTKTFAKYLRLGIIPRIVRGNDKDGEYMYSIYHDDVQYCIDDCGDYELDNDMDCILESLHARELIIERNHEVVKEIYDFLSTELSTTDIWVRVGTGMQLNVSFGTYYGEIAVLLMDFIDHNDFEKIVDEIKETLFKGKKIPENIVSEQFVIMANGEENVNVFKNYKNDKIKVFNIDDYYGD